MSSSHSSAHSQTVRTRLHGSQRRSLIEKAACELFADRGYHGTSMGEIAKRSGITIPIVYDHFRSKKDLHHHLLHRHLSGLQERCSERSATNSTLGDLLEVLLDGIETDPCSWQILFSETPNDETAQLLRRRAKLSMKCHLLARFDDHGEQPDDSVELQWEVLLRVLHVATDWRVRHGHVPRGALVDAIGKVSRTVAG